MPPPLAYFLTFRTYGTWVPGDSHDFVDHRRNGGDASRLAGNDLLEAQSVGLMPQPPRVFGDAERNCVQRSIELTCKFRGWRLHGSNVRTNHVHVVVAADVPPEQVLSSLKAWATRRLREEALVGPAYQVWARHASTQYLWKEGEVLASREYVLHGQ